MKQSMALSLGNRAFDTISIDRKFQKKISRLTTDDKVILVAKIRELELDGPVTAWYLHKWAAGKGRRLLSRVPSRTALQLLLEKSHSEADVADIVRDRPRSQAARTGKFAPISRKVKAAVIKKAKNSNRPRHKRRVYSLSRERHAGRKLSSTSVASILKAAGLAFRRSRATIAMKVHHMTFRRRIAERWGQKPKEFWRQYLFSDEKTFRMSRARHRQNDGLWVDVVDPSETDKEALTHVVDRYAGSVSVWGGISWYGKAELDFVVGTQDGSHYCNKVITERVKPFMDAHPEVKVFQQDGASLHKGATAVSHMDNTLGAGNWTRPPPPPCKETLSDGTFAKVAKTSANGRIRNYKIDSTSCHCYPPSEYVHPAKSPDLNITEHAWSWMVGKLNQNEPPRSEAEFHNQIKESWADMPMEYIWKLFDSIPSRFAEVVACNGAATRY